MRETSGRDSQNVSSNYICIGTVIPSIIIGPLYIYFQNSNQKPPSLPPQYHPQNTTYFSISTLCIHNDRELERDVWRICFLKLKKSQTYIKAMKCPIKLHDIF